MAITNQSLVSVIIPFYNPPIDFMIEAVESVIEQTYQYWEIILVDDGSDLDSEALARKYVAQFPEKVRLTHHEGRANRGLSASRQLGIHRAQGEYIAFLDADDVWLPDKLVDQVSLMEQHPEAAMLYGTTLYWYSWKAQSQIQTLDFFPRNSIRKDKVFAPGELLPLYLLGKTAVPCTCSVIIRRQAVHTTGGFEEAFTGMYEDQVFYAKMTLSATTYVSHKCWDYYRQHKGSMSSISESSGENKRARLAFLNWLEGYLITTQVRNPDIWQALRRSFWMNHEPGFSKLSVTGKQSINRAKKWLLKLHDLVLPAPIRRWIWAREFKSEEEYLIDV